MVYGMTINQHKRMAMGAKVGAARGGSAAVTYPPAATGTGNVKTSSWKKK